MEFIDYLVENYKWLIIITAILIITVIGFIADSRSEKAKKKKLESQPIIKPDKKEEIKPVTDDSINIVSEPVIEEKNLIEPNNEVVMPKQPDVVEVPNIINEVPNVVPADNINTVQEDVIPVNTVIEETQPINIPFREDNIINAQPTISNNIPEKKPEVLDFDQMNNMVQEKNENILETPVVNMPQEEVKPTPEVAQEEAINSWDQFDNVNDPLGSTVNMTDFLSQIETPKVMSHQNGEEVKETPSDDENDLWKL